MKPEYTDYTLTAIFAESKDGVVNGRVWPVTIGEDYKTVKDAVSAIEKLTEKYRGSNAEIIDYTITRSITT